MKNKFNISGVALLLSTAAVGVAAQEAVVERVTVTGSSIKRIDAETAFPITVIKAEEFARKGMTSIEEMLTSLSVNQQSSVAAGSVGAQTGGKSSANLRGLGDGRTLVLLNGRRLANHPFDGSSADLYSIPFSAIDRIEVLRDGASHIYGADAIAGVINFITKRALTDTTVSAEAVLPQQSGAREQRASLSTGFGKLDTDDFNVYAAIDFHQQGRLMASERPFSNTGVLPDKGISKTSGTTFPANFFSSNGITGNPAFQSGCLPPYAIKSGTNQTCREDYARFSDAIPETRQTSALAKATFRLGAGRLAALEYLHADSVNITHIAPPPMTGLIMHSSSKWYPGGTGGTPFVAGLKGEDLNVSWRTVEGGLRKAFNRGVSDRLVASINGDVAGWDLSLALSAARTKVAQDLAGGYVNDKAIQKGINDGILNPFALQDTAGAALLATSQVRGEVIASTARNAGLDLRVTRDLLELPSGPLGFAAGLEGRRESSDFELRRGPLDQMLISRASGLESAADLHGSRTLSAVFAEANIPLTSQLEAQLAARYDRYSDAGSASSPKVGFRYQPGKQWLVRGSYNTGFRAPTLYELNGPIQNGITSTQYNDPVLCPGGVAKAGVNPNISCNMNLPTRYGGNPELKPEHSKAFTFGLVLEPAPALTVSLDYSKIRIRDLVGAVLYEEAILGDYDKYRDRYHYTAAGTALDYINVSSLGNAGERQTQVFDLTAQWRWATSAGSFDAWFNGSYVWKDSWQDMDGANQDNLNIYNGTTRWRHNVSIRWTQGPWSATLSERYTGAYQDQNLVAEQYKQKVAANSVWALTGSYTGFKNVQLVAGIKNLLNSDPPFSNQAPNTQTGYDPRYADPVGRALFMRATYKF